MALSVWLTFFVAAWLISLSPGAGAIAAMTAGMSYGVRRGLWNLLGLQLGMLVLLAIVALGLGALLQTSALLFNVVKGLGVGYLIYLGIMQWRSSGQLLSTRQAEDGASARALVARGFLVNATNPKGIIFMAAVLPQFIDPARPLPAQYAICAGTLILTDVVVMTGYTAFASRVLGSLRHRSQYRLMNRSFGTLFVVAGLLLAAFRRPGL